MLNVKFKKTADAVYISHIDMQNAINRSIRRAGFEPKLSGGFNPHTLLKLSPPLPLGIESEAEYFTVYIDDIDPATFVQGYNENAPFGLAATCAVRTKTYPNLAGNIIASDYIIRDTTLHKYTDKLAQQIQEGFIIAHKTKKEVTERSVSGLIIGFNSVDEGLFIRLASGNITLRPDRFVEAINSYFGLDISPSRILRTAQYVQHNDTLTNADAYIATLQ